MSVTVAGMDNSDYGVGCQENTRSGGPPIICEADLAISTTFFATFPKEVYVVELNATNSQDASGELLIYKDRYSPPYYLHSFFIRNLKAEFLCK